jgi:hypothetical protein
MDKIELFYNHGVPRDIIYNGRHKKFTRSQSYTGQFIYEADFGAINFMHGEGYHMIQSYPYRVDDEQVIWICEERKKHIWLHGPGTGTAIPKQPETSPLS